MHTILLGPVPPVQLHALNGAVRQQSQGLRSLTSQYTRYREKQLQTTGRQAKERRP